MNYSNTTICVLLSFFQHVNFQHSHKNTKERTSSKQSISTVTYSVQCSTSTVVAIVCTRSCTRKPVQVLTGTCTSSTCTKTDICTLFLLVLSRKESFQVWYSRFILFYIFFDFMYYLQYLEQVFKKGRTFFCKPVPVWG